MSSTSTAAGTIKRRRWEKRKRDGKRWSVPYLTTAYTQTRTSQPLLQKRKTEINCQALSFSQGGLQGLIRAPSPSSSALELRSMQNATEGRCTVQTRNYSQWSKSGSSWSVRWCLWHTNINHNHHLSGQCRPPFCRLSSGQFEWKPCVPSQSVSARRNRTWKPGVKFLEVSGMCGQI